MKRSRWAGLAAALSVGAAILPLTGGAAQEDPQATEVGVTEDEIRIAVIADVDNAARPGLFKGSVDGIRAFAEFINERGGLAGRTLTVDFIDSRLSADEARNALVKACQEDFAIVGTTALFVNNIDPLVNCVDMAGNVTGLPDLPVVATEVDHQCSPVSYPALPNPLRCETRNDPKETYRINVGSFRYHLERNDDLHGVWLLPGDLQATVRAVLPLLGGAEKVGFEADDTFEASGLATQSEYTPYIQAIKDNDSTYATSVLDYKSTVFLRREAAIQGVTSVEVWDCFLQCYDRRLLEEGGTDVEREYVSVTFVPFEEAGKSKSLRNYLRYVGRDNADGFGAQAWVAGLLFGDVVDRIVEEDGPNGLTRGRFLEEIAQVHDFDADGIIGPVDVGRRQSNGCYAMLRVEDGEFVRLHPEKTATFDCDDDNVVDVKLDLYE